jgi:hypothetical protein
VSKGKSCRFLDASGPTPFHLSKAGGTIALFAEDGTQINLVTYGPQTGNVSMARCPDGGASVTSMTTPTLRAPNECRPDNTPPVLAELPDRAVREGEVLSFRATATDADVPPETLAFSLDPGAPAGAAIDAATGWFAWTAGTTNFVTIRVTDDGQPAASDAKSFAITVYPPLRVLGLTPPSNGVVTFTYSTIPGASYLVQFKNNLDDPNWTALNALTPATGTVATVSDNIGSHPQRFYRIAIGN